MAKAHNRRCAARWTGILRDCAQSGLKVAEFCRRRSIARPSFYAWRRRLVPLRLDVRAPTAPQSMSAPATLPVVPPFLPVLVSGPAPRPAHRTTLDLVLRGGRRATLSTDLPAEDLARLLGALEGLPC